jgi:hypothetical protein
MGPEMELKTFQESVEAVVVKHLVFAGLAILAWVPLPAAARPPQKPVSLPLVFVPNRGQVSLETEFMVQGRGLTAYFRRNGAAFSAHGNTMEIEFAGRTGPTRIEGIDPGAGAVNFLVGQPADWRVGLPIYSGIVYHDLYPGIDLVYRADGGQLKSEFRVAPGADAARIRTRYVSAERLNVEPDGTLNAGSRQLQLRDSELLLYQERDGAQIEVEGSFMVNGDTVSYAVGGYDRSRPLIIDPVLNSVWLGGNSDTVGLSLAVDSSGAAYVAGYTSTYDLPSGSNPVTRYAGGNDAVVFKLNQGANALVFCTYIGGRGDDRAYGIAVDSSGHIYLTGSTTSSNFPTLNAIQSKLAGSTNAFVAELTPLGNALVYSTYLGGKLSDVAYAIALDSTGSVYIGGQTTSTDFPATGYQKTSRGRNEGFLAKISPAGSLSYSTYFGGSADDSITALAIDPSGSVYVTGCTYSLDLPIVNAYQRTNAGGQDAFVARFDAAGASLLFSTYLGGSGGSLGAGEMGLSIAVDRSSSAYVTGMTSSIDFPVLNAVQSTNAGWLDAFATKFSSAGTLLYSTYIGGGNVDIGNAIAVDTFGNAYIAGQTVSRTLCSLVGSSNPPVGDYDAFIITLNSSGAAATALTLIGGRGSDGANAIAIDAASNIWIAGHTLSSDFPTTATIASLSLGNYGAFVAKLSSTAGISVALTPALSAVFQGQTLQLSVTVGNTSNTSVNWSFSQPGLGSITAAGLYTAPASITTSQALTLTAQSTADPTKTASATILLQPAVVTSSFEDHQLAGWTPFGGSTATIVSSPAIGQYSLYLSSASGGGIYQDLSGLQPGQWYTATARIQAQSGSTGNAELYLHDTAGNNAGFDIRQAVAGRWDTLETQFLATSTGRVRIHLQYLGSSGAVILDDIRLIQGWHTGFENGLTLWSAIGPGGWLSSTTAVEGTNSVVETASGGVYRDVAGLLPGQVYHVAARTHSLAGSSARANLWVHDSTGARAVAGGSLIPSPAGWDLLEADFVAGANGILRLHLLNAGGTGSIYWDDIQITTGGGSGFETGALASWNPVGVTAAVNSGNSSSGMYSLQLSGSPGLVYRDITGLEIGKTYRIEVRVRSAPGANGAVTLWVHDTANANVAQYGPRLASSTQWETYSVNFRATSTGAARIHLLYSGGAGAAYLDQVTIQKGWVADFENGLTGWSTFGGTASAITTAVSYAGSNAISQTGNAGGIYQDVFGLTAGQKYWITVHARLGSGSPSVLLWAHNTLGGSTVQDGPRNPPAGYWGEWGVVFTADGTGAVRIHLYDFAGNGLVYLDQVAVVPVNR